MQFQAHFFFEPQVIHFLSIFGLGNEILGDQGQRFDFVALKHKTLYRFVKD